MDDLKDVLYKIDNTSMRNVVLLGFTTEVLDKARKHLEELSLSGKEEVIISFKKEDFEVIDSFVRSQCLSEYQDMMGYSLIRDHIYYLIIKQIKMDVPEKRFLEYYEKCFEAIKNNDFDVYRKNHVKFLFGCNDSMVPREKLNNFRVNFFVDDYNNSIIQEVINSLISSRCETIFVYSSANNLLTNKCGDSIIRTIHDYSLLNSAKLTKKISDSINKMTHSGDYVETPVKQTKEKAITPRIEFERIADEKKKAKEMESKIKFWYPMENYAKGSKKMIPIPKSEYYLGDKPEPTTIEVDLSIVRHDYYGIKDLLGQLPIDALPISKEAIDRLKETDLKSIFEKTLASTYGETFIRSIDKIAIMGFDSFKNKAKVYRKSPITTVERFYKGYDERKQFVIANIDQLFNYLIKLLTAKKDNRFIPIKTLSNCGSYNNYHSYRDFIRAITSVDERILESISLYMEQNDMTKEEPFKNAARRLINTPSKERNIIKKGL